MDLKIGAATDPPYMDFLGLFTMTASTISGSYAGANPTKEAIYLFSW